MNNDAADLREMEAMLQQMTQPELERFCEGTLRAAELGQRVYLARFPLAWIRFNEKIEKGEIR